MAALLSRPLSDDDDSYWTVNLNTTSPPNYPPEGLLNINLSFNETRLTVFQDEYGNPRHSEQSVPSCTAVHTLNLPGTLNRSEYRTALHQWLQSYFTDQIPIDGDEFANRLINRVFRRVEFLEKVAICVQVDLYHVSVEYEYGDELEKYVEETSGFFRVVATEEHRRFGDCSICLEGLVSAGEEEEVEKNFLFGSPCGHFFHSECMEKWLRMSDSCPMCRFDISSSMMEE